MNTNGKKRNRPSGCVDLFLERKDSGPPVTIQYTLCITGAEGVETRGEDVDEFTEENSNWGFSNFLSRDVLRDHQSLLMPNGVLTVTCIMKIVVPSSARIGLLSYQDTTTQTEVESTESSARTVGSQLLNKQDASIQTDEELKEDEAVSEKNHSLEKQAAFDDEAQENNDSEDHEESKKKKKKLSQVKNTKKISLPTRHGSVIRNLKAILAEGRRADFTLKSGGREWPVHRAILEGRSGHFEALFRGEWAGRDEVRFDDVAEGALDSVLHLIYAGEVGGMSVENVRGIYVAAHKFRLEDLKSLCVEYMKKKICLEMVCFALAIAETYGEGDLKDSALECFFRESTKIVATEGWKNLKENHPTIMGELFQEFIKRERMNRRNEQD